MATLPELHSKRLGQLLSKVFCETNVAPNKLLLENEQETCWLLQEKFSTVLLASPNKLGKFSFRKKSVSFIFFWIFVSKTGAFGENLLACLAKLQFTCSDVQIEEKVPVQRKSFLLTLWAENLDLNQYFWDCWQKNIGSVLKTAFFKNRRTTRRYEIFDQKLFVSWFFRTRGKSFELMEKKHFFRSNKIAFYVSSWTLWGEK